jgi:hypothetical protein
MTYSYADTVSVPLNPQPFLSVLVCLEIHSAITQRKYAERWQNEDFETC